jgi:hypothetical protein
MKLSTALMVALSVASFAPAQTSTSSTTGATVDANPNVRHIIGLDAVKLNASGKLTVQDGVLEFKTGKAGNKVLVSSIDDVFIGTETTQAGGKKGRVVKTAAIAAPYETGRALPILMRTKVDILTVSFHDTEGALHGAIFALPIGQAEQMRAQLVHAGAHASPIEK